MGRTKKLTMYGLAFSIFMVNLTLVEDFNQDTCDWICSPADLSTNIEGEKLGDLMAQARLIKFKIFYEERVDHEKCTNQAANVSGDSSTFATVWLKNVTDAEKQKTRGSMQFIAQTFYEGIFALGGSDLHLNVSCVYTSTSTTKSATTHSSRWRLTFDTAQSVLYYIEHLANNTKTNDTFLTLLRVENRTRLSFGATGTAGNSYLASTKDNELTFSDGWLFVAVIIWFLYLLYSPAIFLLFRPSDVAVRCLVVRNQIRKTQKEAKYPVQETMPEDTNDVFIKVDIANFMHRTPDEGNESSPHQSDSGSNTEELGACGYTPSGRLNDTDNAITAQSFSVLVEETENPTEQNSKIVCGPRRTYKAFRPMFVGQENTEKELGILKDEFEDGSTGADRIPDGLSSGVSTSNGTFTIDSSATGRNDEELSGSDRNVGSNDSADGSNIWNVNPLYISPRLHAERKTDTVQSSRDEEKETVPAVIVGGTYPVGLGSFIADPLNAWIPCYVHRMHPTCIVFERLRCLFSNIPSFCNWFYCETCPCKECKKLAPPDCCKYLELPENILHNLEKLPDIFVKYWDSFVGYLSECYENKTIASFGLTLLALLFVFLIISSNVSSDAVAPSTSNVIAFLAVAYFVINKAIIGEKLDFSKEDADKTVDNFIKRKQDSD
ncbi:hypothetical protein OS493_014824 [Desmophyllum pertusum]|uniref:Uncharacterized protein n=1 Tax=Desmophyllum pertusum TaxID=174260 RepID=A0A9W9YD93_9CNID|nr:hypothetical protein OS493_014824 [Desmophyllum pertusum]